MYGSRKRTGEWILCRFFVCTFMCVYIYIRMCAYLGGDCEKTGNTAANVVQIDVELYLSLALSFSLSQ